MNLSRKHIPVIIGLVLLLLIVARVALYLWDQSHDEDTWFEKVVLVTFDNDPELLSVHKPAIKDEFSRYKNRLTDISEGAEKSRSEIARGYLLEWENLPNDSSDPILNAKFKLIKNYLDLQSENEEYFIHWFPANPYNGVQMSLPVFFSMYHAIASKEDCDAYITRLKTVDIKLRQATAGIAYRKEQNLVPPASLLYKSIAQIDTFLALPLTENPFYINFSRRVIRVNPLDVNEYDAANYLSSIARVLDKEIFPAYQELRTVLVELAKEVEEKEWKGNRPYFSHQLKKYHREIDSEVLSQIFKEMNDERSEYKDRLENRLNTLDLPESVFTKQIEYLNQTYRLAGDSANYLLKTSRSILDDISVKSLGLFQIFDKPIRLEVATSRNYWHPEKIYLLDNNTEIRTKSSLLIDIAKYTTHPEWRMKSLIYRQGIPGRYALIKARAESVEQEDFWEILEPMSFRSGWNLYIDQVIANEIMLYSTTPVDEAGYLYNMYLDFLGGMIDLGLHHEGWTDKEALNFLIEKAELPELDATEILEKSVSDPGRLLSVWLGYQEIVALRKIAKDKLGNDFILQEFHDFLLKRSPTPWELMEKQLENYFSEKMAS